MRPWLAIGLISSGLLLISACRECEQCDDAGPSGEVVQGQVRAGADTQPADAEEDGFELLGSNAACYVCHMTFVEEELSVVHLEAKVGCVDCHGISAGHANDEDIGATPPDKVFKGDKIDQFCRMCHETHDVDPAKVVARWQERSEGKPATQPAQQTIRCTACHGEHRIGEGG